MGEQTVILELGQEEPEDHTGPVLDVPTQTIDLEVPKEQLSETGSFLTDDLDFQKFMNLMPNLIFLVERSLQIVLANRTAQDYIKAGELETLVGVPFTSLSDDNRVKATTIKITNLVFEHKKPRTIECLLKIGKKAIWSKSTFSPVKVAGQRMLMCVTQDLSAEKLNQHKLLKQQQQITQAKEEAARAVAKAESLQMVRDVAGGVVHNFNNILTIITTASYLASKTDEIDVIHKQVGRIQDATARGTSTVDRLASFVRSLTPHTNPKELDMSKLVTNAIEFARPFWHDLPEQNGYKIHIKSKIEPDIKVIGIESELSETVLNLIKNACEAMTEDGVLYIGLKAGMGSVLLQISDTGPGIPPDISYRVFAPFFTTKGQNGSGMGLATCKQIIEKHNGSISFTSSPGQTTFTVSLPEIS